LFRVSNFRSIENAEFELAPLTILIGPPASGKSNILDALAFAGYFNRILLLDKEYENNASKLEPPQLVLRFTSLQQLFTWYDLTRRISVELTIDPGEVLAVELWFRQGRPELSVNGVVVPWDLVNLPPSPFTEVRNALSQATKGKLLVESRLYGYDRYGLASLQCVSPTLCGFNMRLKGIQTMPTPRNILSEFGWNGSNLARSVRDVVIELNDLLRETMGGRTEIVFTSSGSVMVLDYHYEVEPISVSDTIFRALYYLMALKTSANYAKLYGLEKRFMLLLEEPEAHVFPYYLDILADYIAKVKDYLYVIVATHNPLLISMLWDRVKDLKTYYVARDPETGSTKVFEIDVEKLAEDLETPEELLLMTQHEVASKYVAQHGVKAAEQKAGGGGSNATATSR